MAVATDFQDLRASLKVDHYDFDPGGTDAVDVGWVDMQDYDAILITFFRTVGTSNLDTFAIIANSESDGSGTDATVKTHAVANEPNAVGDYIVLEVSAEEIRQVETSSTGQLRYVSASVEFATGTDEGVVTYIRKARHAQRNLTAESVA